jgi:hypothetical protein
VNVNGRIEIVGEIPTVSANSVTEGAFFIKIPEVELEKRKTKLKINIFRGDELIDDTKTTFLGPPK